MLCVCDCVVFSCGCRETGLSGDWWVRRCVNEKRQWGGVAVMQSGSLAVWQSGSLADWQSGGLAVWQSGTHAIVLAPWQSGSLAVWQSACLAVWRSGSLAVWLSVWLSVCLPDNRSCMLFVRYSFRRSPSSYTLLKRPTIFLVDPSDIRHSHDPIPITYITVMPIYYVS